MKNIKSNKILFIFFICFIFLSIGLASYIIGNKPNNDSRNDEQKNDNNLIDEDEENEINEPYQTKLPSFNDEFEQAMFIYSWFYDNSELMKFIDINNKNNNIEPEYYLLMIDEIKSIDDMKKYAYEVFDKEFIDMKFNEISTSETPMFKNSKYGVIVNIGYVAQYNYDMGYSTYQKIDNNNGTVTYSVHLEASIMGDGYGCDVMYEYNAEKNSDGKLIFKTFENPTEICLKDANSKIHKYDK